MGEKAFLSNVDDVSFIGRSAPTMQWKYCRSCAAFLDVYTNTAINCLTLDL